MGLRQGAKLSIKEGGKNNKRWEQEWGNKPSSQSRAVVDYWASLLWDWGWYSNQTAPFCCGRSWPDRVASVGNHNCHLEKTMTIWQPCMNWQWGTSGPNNNPPCGQKEPNTVHKPVTLWNHFRDPTCKGWPIRPRKVEKEKEKEKTLQPFLPQAVWQERQILPHEVQNCATKE
jgi:hypothetical protein